MHTRLQFALLGALACIVASLLAEAVFARAHLAQTLDDRAGRVLIFRSDLARRLENVGGKTGDIEIALAWNNENDLDLSVVDPTEPNNPIYYGHKRSRSGGELDVDANFIKPYTREPVENIYWPIGRAPRGRYIVRVTYWENHGGPATTAYRCVIFERGRLHQITGTLSLDDLKRPKTIFEFDTGNSGPSWAGLLLSLLHATLITGFWATLMATLLALALAGGQQRLWLRRYSQPLMPNRALWRIVAWGAVAGVASGVLGQLLFSLVSYYYPTWPVVIGRGLGWALLGTMMGWGLAMRVPHLPRRAAAIVGGVGGVLGACSFMAALGIGSDLFGRVLAAGLLGFLIGMLIRLEIEPEEQPDQELLAAHRLTMQAMRLRPNRAASAGSLRGHRAPPE